MPQTVRPIVPLTFLLAVAALGMAAPASPVWTVIAVDLAGDGRAPSAPDAAQLSYQYDAARDLVWFRLSLYGKLATDAFTIRIAVDTGSDDARTSDWWGINKDFAFNRLITARIAGMGAGRKGSVVVSDAHIPAGTETPSLTWTDGSVRVEDNAIVLGVPLAKLGASRKMNLIAATGSGESWNDDIPNLRSAAIDLLAPRPSRGLREIDTSRNNLRPAPGLATLPDGRPARIARRGHGPKTLILVPGVYSGGSAFETFIARNEAAYTFHVVTPPGLIGTPARALPPEGTSTGEFTWTRRLARDIAELIAREHLDKPIVVAHGFPGSLAAEALAVDHPELLAGIVEIAGMPVQAFPSMRDANRQATPSERIAIVDAAWLKQWFKFVTPETWESNNYPADMFAIDPERGERARKEVEAAPLPVKIRYLVEFMASDHRAAFGTLGVPLLALIPGFSDAIRANPAFAWFKTSFQDSWEGLPANPRVERTVVPDGRALMLDEQPALLDRAIASFVDRSGRVVIQR